MDMHSWRVKLVTNYRGGIKGYSIKVCLMRAESGEYLSLNKVLLYLYQNWSSINSTSIFLVVSLISGYSCYMRVFTAMPTLTITTVPTVCPFTQTLIDSLFLVIFDMFHITNILPWQTILSLWLDMNSEKINIDRDFYCCLSFPLFYFLSLSL